MKYFIIAGEASGDLHGSNLMEGILQADVNAEFRYFGGDLMNSKGGVLVKHYREMAFMGFVEVFKNFKTISKNYAICKQEIKKFSPDVVILIDYPSFNLRIAEYVKSLGIKVYYYISPKIWAWKEYRIKKIKQLVDKMLVIFPFEVEYYKKHNYTVYYEGNPLLDAIEQKIEKKSDRKIFLESNHIDDKPIVAILPGSRIQEIKRILPVMLQIINNYKEYQFVIAGTTAIGKADYLNIIKDQNVKIVYNQTYDLLMHSTAAIVTSGTAALETALFNIPQVVCYITSKSTYFIAKTFVKLNYISLVNLIMDKPVVKELIQDEMNSSNLQKEMDKILFDEESKNLVFENYKKLREMLGNGGASNRFGKLIYNGLINN